MPLLILVILIFIQIIDHFMLLGLIVIEVDYSMAMQLTVVAMQKKLLMMEMLAAGKTRHFVQFQLLAEVMQQMLV